MADQAVEQPSNPFMMPQMSWDEIRKEVENYPDPFTSYRNVSKVTPATHRDPFWLAPEDVGHFD